MSPVCISLAFLFVFGDNFTGWKQNKTLPASKIVVLLKLISFYGTFLIIRLNRFYLFNVGLRGKKAYFQLPPV